MTDKRATDVPRNVDRRSLLLGVGGAALGIGGVATGASVLADEHEDDETGAGPRDGPMGSPQGVLDQLRTEAFLMDLDGDGAFTTHMHLSDGPTEKGRKRAVHVSSDGEPSEDYAVAGVDLRGDSLSLGEAANAGTISYDYYKGSAATHRVPDEVFLAFRTGFTRFAGAVRGADADQPETWETRDVSSEIATESWRVLEMDVTELDVGRIQREFATDDLDANDVVAILERESVLDRIETVHDLTSRFGQDANLLAMALGVGATDGAVNDAYYSNLQVAGEHRPIPAVLGMEPSFGRRRGRFTVSLSFMDGEHGLTAEDVDVDSVRMTSRTPVAPPLPLTPQSGNAAAASGAGSVTADGAEIEFAPGRVQRLLDGDRPTPVVVYGDFDVPEPYSFVAVGTVEGVGGKR